MGEKLKNSADEATGWEEVAAMADKMAVEDAPVMMTEKRQCDIVVNDGSRQNILTALREKLKRIIQHEVKNTGGTTKAGGVTIEVTRGPFGRRAGMGVLTEDLNDADAALLNAVYVDPKHRGKGIGNAITGAAIKQAKKEGLKRINLNSTDMAVEMYKKHGFVMTNEEIGAMTLDLKDEE